MSRRHRKIVLGNLNILSRDLLPALHFDPLFSTLRNIQKAPGRPHIRRRSHQEDNGRASGKESTIDSICRDISLPGGRGAGGVDLSFFSFLMIPEVSKNKAITRPYYSRPVVN